MPVDRVEVGEDVIHAAELGFEHRLLLLERQCIDPALHPVGLTLQHVERLPRAAVHVDVQQAGHDLVQRVVGRPDRLAGFDAIDELFGEGGKVADACALLGQRLLDLGQLRHDRVGPGLEPRVAGAGIHQRQRRQVMADAVSAQLDVRRLPAAQRLRRRGQAGVDAEVVQQPIGIERQEVSLIAGHRIFERAVEQPHGFRREGLRRGLDLVGDAWAIRASTTF